MTQPQPDTKRTPVKPHKRRVRIGSRDNWHYETRHIGPTSRATTLDNTPLQQPGRNTMQTNTKASNQQYPDTNNVVLVGKVVAGPTLKHVGDKHTALAELEIRVNNPRGEPSILNVQAWAGGAEAVHKFTSLGDQIVVTGRLRTDTYNNQTRTYIDAGTTGIQFTQTSNSAHKR